MFFTKNISDEIDNMKKRGLVLIHNLQYLKMENKILKNENKKIKEFNNKLRDNLTKLSINQAKLREDYGLMRKAKSDETKSQAQMSDDKGKENELKIIGKFLFLKFF